MGEDPIEPQSNIVLHVTSLEQIPFDGEAETRSEQSVTELCSRLNFAIYQGSDKVKALAQKQGDQNYGTAGFNLPVGDYTLVIVGHNTAGTCTFTELDKITFKDNIVSDTYLYSGELHVTAEAQTLALQLRRVVAMFRLVLTDDLPAEVQQMKFYYTGGSSTLSGATGRGSVNSRQTVKLPVSPGQRQFEVFTFPHEETGELKMTISALDANGEVLRERILEHVPVTRNRITRFTGSFFIGETGQSSAFSVQLSASSEWDGEDENEL